MREQYQRAGSNQIHKAMGRHRYSPASASSRNPAPNARGRLAGVMSPACRLSAASTMRVTSEVARNSSQSRIRCRYWPQGERGGAGRQSETCISDIRSATPDWH